MTVRAGQKLEEDREHTQREREREISVVRGSRIATDCPRTYMYMQGYQLLGIFQECLWTFVVTHSLSRAENSLR